MCEGWSFNNVGDSASNLTQIKQWGVTQAKHIDFGNCTNLSGQIPTPVKNSFTTVESFRMLFYNCTNLNSQIPENLFYNATNVITLRNAFNISGVTGNIPENLLSYCTKVENVDYLFDKSNITGSISEGLFNNCSNLKYADGVFRMTAITGRIPERLFWNCPNITSVKFLFESCTGLTGNIPEKLFINQSQLTLRSCFRYCSGLSDSQIKLTSKNIRETDYFCEGVNAKITVYIPRGMENPFTSTSNVTVVEYDI